MSYNGVGLATARGSGTSGFIQRSLSSIKHKTIARSSMTYTQAPQAKIAARSEDILMHEKLREVEIQLLLRRDAMEEDGLEEQEIDTIIDAEREVLVSEMHLKQSEDKKLKVFQTHQLSEMKERDTKRFGEALGISKDYTPGTSFDVGRKEERVKSEREEQDAAYQIRQARRDAIAEESKKRDLEREKRRSEDDERRKRDHEIRRDDDERRRDDDERRSERRRDDRRDDRREPDRYTRRAERESGDGGRYKRKRSLSPKPRQSSKSPARPTNLGNAPTLPPTKSVQPPSASESSSPSSYSKSPARRRSASPESPMRVSERRKRKFTSQSPE